MGNKKVIKMIIKTWFSIIFNLVLLYLQPVSNKPKGKSIMTRKNHSRHSSNINDSLNEMLFGEFSSLINALNDQPSTMMDSGQPSVSTQDIGLRIELSTLCSFYWRQNHGKIQIAVKGPDGKPTGAYRTISNNKERLDDSYHRQANIQNVGNIGPDDFKTLYYLSVNEARFEHCESMLQHFATIYRNITNEEWKPVLQSPVKTVDVSSTEQAKYVAMLEKANKRTSAAI